MSLNQVLIHEGFTVANNDNKLIVYDNNNFIVILDFDTQKLYADTGDYEFRVFKPEYCLNAIHHAYILYLNS